MKSSNKIIFTHHEKVAGQNVFGQIIVGQIEHLKHRKCTESTRQLIQSIDRYVEYAKLWHRRQRHGQINDVIIGQIQYFQIDEIRNAWRNAGQFIVAQCDTRNMDHVYCGEEGTE